MTIDVCERCGRETDTFEPWDGLGGTPVLMVCPLCFRELEMELVRIYSEAYG